MNFCISWAGTLSHYPLTTLILSIMENLDDELRENASLLRDLKMQDDGFRMPDGYFDELENQVFGRLDALGARRAAPLKAKPGGQLLHRLLQPRILMAMAAGLALITAAVWFFKPRPAVDQTSALAQVQMPDLSEEDIETYVIENVQEFDTDQLASLPVTESAEQLPDTQPAHPGQHRSKRQQALDDLYPEDLDNLLHDLSDEDLEKLL